MTEVGFNAPQYGYGNAGQEQQPSSPSAPPFPPAPPTPPYPAHPQASYEQQRYAPPAPAYQEQPQDPNYLPPSYADPTANMSDPTMLAPVTPPAAPGVAEPGVAEPAPAPAGNEQPVSRVPLVKTPPTDETPSEPAAPVAAPAGPPPVDATSLVPTEQSGSGDNSGSLALPSRPGRVAVQVVDRLGTTGKRGTTTIPPEVIEKIVTVSTREVPGVYAFSGATGTEDGDRAIEVAVEGQQATVSIRLVVEFGYAVHTVTEKVRTKVISALENLFALDVTAVDIAVDDIHIEDAAVR
jgi:uncharacterized alkaline shock family protein YloU